MITQPLLLASRTLRGSHNVTMENSAVRDAIGRGTLSWMLQAHGSRGVAMIGRSRSPRPPLLFLNTTTSGTGEDIPKDFRAEAVPPPGLEAAQENRGVDVGVSGAGPSGHGGRDPGTPVLFFPKHGSRGDFVSWSLLFVSSMFVSAGQFQSLIGGIR